MEMHEDFGPWIKKVDPTGDTETLDNRWKGTVAVLEKLDVDLVDHLTCRHYNISSASNDSAELFESTHKDANPFLNIADAENELRILASAALASAIDQDSQWSDHIALTVLSADLEGHREPASPIDLAGRAKHRVLISGEALRRRKVLKAASTLTTGKFNFSGKVPEGVGLQDHEAALAVLTDIATQMSSELTKVRREARTAVASLTSHIDMKDEELELLWWLFSEVSETRNRPFKELHPAERGLVAGVELAGKLRRVPGPASTPSLLMRVGLDSNAMHKLSDAVDACDSEWVNEYHRNGSSAVTPVHAALAERLRVGKTGGWVAGWSSVVGCDAELSLSEQALAIQTYLEAGYLRSRLDMQE